MQNPSKKPPTSKKAKPLHISRVVKFIKSAVEPQHYPQTGMLEVAFAGRSNAGKSSLINTLAHSKIAHVSKAPGKTRLLNFFSVGEQYVLVDMPGYGYASRSNSEQDLWQQMVESYMRGRENLVGLVLVMDIRREWDDEERILKKFLNSQGLSMVIVLTKSDKISRSDVLKAVQKIKKEAATVNVFAMSSLNKQGIEEVEEFIYDNWIKPFKNKVGIIHG